jgi:hypothetical protein
MTVPAFNLIKTKINLCLILILKIMEKLCTNKNHSYKHNEQINKQNIDNSECLGVTSKN